MRREVLLVAWLPASLAALPRLVSADQVCTAAQSALTVTDAEAKSHLVVFVIITILIVLTILFEIFKDKLEELAEGPMQPIMDSVWGELTVLGFIGLIAFIVQKTDALVTLSCRVFGDPDTIPEDLENVHMLLFLVMVMFLIEVVALMMFGKHIAHRWRHLEERTRDEAAVLQEWMTTVRTRSMREVLGLDVFSRTSSLRERVEFMLMRRAFVSQHESCETDFEFAHYMSLVIGRELGDIVEVKLATWLILELVILAFYLYFRVSDTAKIAGVFAFVWASLGGLLLVREKLNRIHSHLTPEPPLSVADAEMNEHTPLAVLELAAPKFLRQPLVQRSCLGRLLFGDPPNRHERLFWFDRYGPRFLFSLIQCVLLLSSVYIAVLSFYLVNVVARMGLSALGRWLLYMAGYVPVLLVLVWLMPTIVMRYVEVCNIEMLKRDAVVKDVARTMKTTKALRAMRMLHVIAFAQFMRDKRAAKAPSLVGSLNGPGPISDDPSCAGLIAASAHLDADARAVFESIAARAPQMDARRLRELREMFVVYDTDSSGRLDLDEVASLMAKLGSEPMERAMLVALVSAVDTDGNCELDCDEFVELVSGFDTVKSMDVSDSVLLLFRMLDVDRSGKISLSELRDALNAMGQAFSVTEVEELLRDIDRDGDGEVDMIEFRDLIEKYGEVVH